MTTKQSPIKRALSLILCLVFMLPLLTSLVGRDGNAQAIVSLPYVESIKQSGGALKILEIVPAATQGSLGSYISGQEPWRNWQASLSTTVGVTARSAMVNKLFDDLHTANILGDSDSTPLKLSSAYQEKFPWDSDLTGFSALPLAAQEIATVSGRFGETPGPGSTGTDFAQDVSYALAKGTGKTATHVQDVRYFNYFSEMPDEGIINSFWYNPSFAKNTLGELVAGTAVYTKSGEAFTFAGYAHESVEIIDPTESYYVVNGYGEISAVWTAACPYSAVSQGFRLPTAGETATFYAESTTFTYVGAAGTHCFTPGAGTTHQVNYKLVFTKGGFTSNDWFLRHVFDWDNSKKPDGSYKEPRPTKTITVSTRTPATLTQEDIQGASLIVLSQGFNPGGTAEVFSTTNDLSLDMLKLLKSTCTSVGNLLGKPTLIDSSLTLGTLEINNLARELTVSTPGVKSNIFTFGGKIATKDFNSPLVAYSSQTQPNSPYYQVYKGIADINFYRKTVSHEALLPEIISIATSIREIINFSGKLSSEKTTINVLDLEPGRGAELSSEQVGAWLGVAADKISITTMATAEFIGKIDNVSEKYDMVYIGANASNVGSFPSGNGPDYYDNSMDGLIYSNIGDIVTSGSPYTSSGLLERDYNQSGGVVIADLSRTFRYPGNDITKVAMEKLNSFVASGYPVVVSSSLFGGGISVAADSGSQGSADCYRSTTSLGTCKFSAPLIKDENKKTLSVSIGNITSGDVGDVTAATYQWLECTDGSDKFVDFKGTGARGTSISIAAYPAGSKFKCEITPTTVSQGLTSYPGGNRTLKNVASAVSSTAALASAAEIDPNRVDNCSYMYEFLTKNLAKPNVMSANETTKESKLRSYVDIAKPEIAFSKNADGSPMLPAVYSNTGGNVNSLVPVDGACSLNYTFSIVGPDTATYICNLYLDGNGDGLYSDTEKLSDIVVREKNNGIIGDLVASNSLKSDQEYFATSRLPLSQVGIVPWKLEIVKNVPAGQVPTHDSYRSYSHVKPQEGTQTVIKILQIDSTRSNNEKIDLEDHMTVAKIGGSPLDPLYSPVTQKTYKGIYGKLFADVTDFKVEIKHLLASELPKNLAEITEYLNNYNMLVLGFDDAYRGLSLSTTKAIVEYQKNPSHALLVTHDNTSFYFAPDNQKGSDGKDLYGGLSGWVGGYYFNMLVRNVIGMDVYGIADSTYGFTKFSPQEVNPKETTGIVASGRYPNITAPSESTALLENGYRLAYAPKSGTRDANGNLTKFQTVAETQGLATGILIRYYTGGGKPTTDSYKNATPNNENHMELTTTISQINEGQITSYPYDVNTDAFKPKAAGNAKNSMNVASTHYQYLQLNMNRDDVVVWYTLSGGEYDYYKNDVSNSYYIYNMGNVTYSGAGHTTTAAAVNANVNEAKLFVNTMIAAYRVTNIKPEARFTDKTGTSDIFNFLVPSDNNVALNPGKSGISSGVYDDSRKIYFSVYDSTASETKLLNVNFKYQNKDITGLTIYNAQTNAIVLAGPKDTLKSGATYYVKLDELLSKIGTSLLDGGSLLIGATATNTIDGSTISSAAFDNIKLRQLELFSLS